MKIIVIIPCFNEEITIAKVVGDFMAELPDAQICVVDNNSTDRSLERAAAAGAIIKKECRQGKGYVHAGHCGGEHDCLFRRLSAA
jgi:glycosyltransferase involved in cell wall biosynthesis